MSKKNVLIKNFVSLSSLQLVNYVIPLLTVPYLTRIIGPEKYGLINLASSVLTYFSLIINYGFDLSATREIARNKENVEKINSIFSSVMVTKLFLFLLSSCIFFFLLFTNQYMLNNASVYIITYLSLFGSLLFPLWLFQGIEKMYLTVYVNLIIKIINTILIFLVIHTEMDFIFLPTFSSLGMVAAGFISLIIIKKEIRISFTVPTVKMILSCLKEGRSIFISTLVISLYTNANVIILGILTSDKNVGNYTLSTKIIGAVISLISSPLSQTIYPHIADTFRISRQKGIEELKKFTLIIGSLTLIISLFLFSFAKELVVLILGPKYFEAIDLIRILSFIPFIISLSNIFGIQAMLNLNMDNKFLLITFFTGIFSIIINFLIIPFALANGAAFTWLLSESIILIIFYVMISKNGVKLIDFNYYKTYLKGLISV